MPIPYDTSRILGKKHYETEIFKTLRRFFRRYFNFFIKGQRKLEQSGILPEHKKILWIYPVSAQLGDSLMDMSSRVLLKDKEVDLFALPIICGIMKYDNYFNELISDKENLRNRSYDLVIIDVFSSKNLRVKNKFFKCIPFVSMARFFDNAEFDRTLFSFCRMHTLLNTNTSLEDIKKDVKLTLALPQNLNHQIEHSSKIITIVVGGVHPFRTYMKWESVVAELIKQYPDFKFILVGGKNGIEDAKKIQQTCTVDNYVGKLSIFETANIIKQTRYNYSYL